jgi:uncharacterized protein (TIGR02118 family)
MRLRYDEIGQGPAVVLLHARPADRTMWSEHLPLLAAAGYRTIAIDMPGYGESPLPSQGPVAPWVDVLDTLDGLSINQAVLVGNSLGALVALQTAASAPERVRALLLIGYRPHDQPASPRLDGAWQAEATALAADDVDGAVRAGVDAWTSSAATSTVRDHTARMLRANLCRQQATTPPPQAPDPLDDAHAWHALTMPVRVGVGERDMPDFFQGGEGLVHRLNTPPLIVVPGAAHLVPLEQPTRTCVLILNLLREQQTSDYPPATMLVTYYGPANARFDRDYYLHTHLPLVQKTWEPLGLQRVEALFPAAEQTETAALALCHFVDSDAIDRALASLDSQTVMDDITNFTDLTPERDRLAPAQPR